MQFSSNFIFTEESSLINQVAKFTKRTKSFALCTVLCFLRESNFFVDFHLHNIINQTKQKHSGLQKKKGCSDYDPNPQNNLSSVIFSGGAFVKIYFLKILSTTAKGFSLSETKSKLNARLQGVWGWVLIFIQENNLMSI